MKIADLTRKLRHCSTGEITFHIYDRNTRKTYKMVMTHAEIYNAQENKGQEYPFKATLESIDYIQGRLIINGSIKT